MNDPIAGAGVLVHGTDLPASPAVRRWLAGERVETQPMRGAEKPPTLLSFEFLPPKTEALEQQLRFVAVSPTRISLQARS